MCFTLCQLGSRVWGIGLGTQFLKIDYEKVHSYFYLLFLRPVTFGCWRDNTTFCYCYIYWLSRTHTIILKRYHLTLQDGTQSWCWVSALNDLFHHLIGPFFVDDRYLMSPEHPFYIRILLILLSLRSGSLEAFYIIR